MVLDVAEVQMRCRQPIERNVRAICQTIETCREQGVNAICFPELCLSGFDADIILDQKHTIENGVSRVQEAAAAARCHVILGTPTFAECSLHNSAVVIGPHGNIICTYSKVQEEGSFTPGRNIALFEIDGVLCTTVICRDLWHPELLRIAAMKGAALAFVPHATVADAGTLFQLSKNVNHVFRTAPSVRAHENAMYLVLADLVGSFPSGAAHSPGISQIVHPQGVALSKALDYHEDLIVSRINTADRGEDFPAKARDQPFLSELWEPALRKCGAFRTPPG